MATHFHRCDIESICLAKSSYGDGFVAPRPANRHRHATLGNAPPKHGIDEVLEPSGTRLLRYPTSPFVLSQR
jgi:hypothetical protein